jgi:peptidyl-prolyl cis-trans isomerase C
MKISCLSLLAVSACLFAQTSPAPQSPKPATPAAAAPSAPVPDDAVVVKLNGKDMTAGEIRKLLAGTPPQLAQGVARDPKAVLENVLLINTLKDLAERDKVIEQSPWKEMIAFNQKSLLAQAELNYKTNSFPVTPEDEQKYYDTNKSKFEQAKIRVIYISFADPKNPPKQPSDKKTPTEAEAKSKAEDLIKQLRAGANFATLAKQNSEDKTSAEKGGDFGLVRQTDKLSEEIKTAVFGLKPGEISEPVRQPNGFYIIKVDERDFRPLNEVRPDLVLQLRQEKFQQWLKSVQEENKITIQNADFFRTGGATR